jgi:CHAD domain-containing protein
MSRRHDASPKAPTDLRTFAAGRFAVASEALRTHRAGVLDGDAVAVHRARVGLRRLRGALHLHRIFDRARVREVDTEARDLARVLGAVRDLDVIAAQLIERASGLDAPGRSAVELLAEQARIDRGLAVLRLTSPATIARFDALADSLDALAQDPPLAPRRDPDEAAEPVLRAEVARALRRHARTAKKLGAHPPPAAVHELRKGLKRTRYAAADLAASSGRRRDARRATELGRLQDSLGHDQDRVMLLAWLEGVGATSDVARLGWTAGRITEAILADGPASSTWKRSRATLRALD